jgi:hypothetical protein
MKNAAFTMVMLPPHDDIRRGWAARVAELPVVGSSPCPAFGTQHE